MTCLWLQVIQNSILVCMLNSCRMFAACNLKQKVVLCAGCQGVEGHLSAAGVPVLASQQPRAPTQHVCHGT